MKQKQKRLDDFENLNKYVLELQSKLISKENIDLSNEILKQSKIM